MHLNLHRNKKSKVAWIVEHHDWKGYYPFERAAIILEAVEEEVEIFAFVRGANHYSLEQFTSHGITPIIFEHYDELLKSVRSLQVNCIVLDSFDVPSDKVEQMKQICDTLITLDDFSESANKANFNLKALYEETREFNNSNEINGTYFFAASSLLKEIRNYRKLNKTTFNETPHICIYFEDGDKNNLTYRTLRHFIQLHIPLKISVILDDAYSHTQDELSLMALSRKNIQIVRGKDAITETLKDADCLICNSLYTPYKAAFIEIPCITTAQHERELSLGYANENNGFSNIGLGRKMKQSHLQNALMEILLHESRRLRAIKLQQKSQLQLNNDIFQKLVVDLANNYDHFPSIF